MKSFRTLAGCVLLLALSLCIVPFAVAQDNEITNARVVELSKMGLGDDIIIAKFKASPCKFSLTDQDLADLKKAGVSDKVVAAMLEASVLTEAKVTIAGKPAEIKTFGQAKVGGRLGNALTYGIKSVKSKAYLQGPHAPITVGPNNATIVVELPKGASIDDYMVVKLDPKDDRREMEVGSAGGVVGGKSGIRAESIIKTSKTSTGNKHTLVPDKLSKGEYVLYVVGSGDSVKGIYGKGYDFTVE